MKWELLPEFREEYVKKLGQVLGITPRQLNSQPKSSQSPPKVLQPDPLQPPATELLGKRHRSPSQQQQRSVTPPALLTSYRIQPLEAYTPDRGSRLPALRSIDDTLVDSLRAKNSSAGLQVTMASALNTGAAPTPTQPSPFDDDDRTAIMSAVTPAPQRQNPRLAPPSIGQLPSSYLPTSSPAPFWKYVQFESTPAKGGGFGGGGCGGGGGPDFSPPKDLHSSSPPPAEREPASPLKDRFHLGGARRLPLPIPRLNQRLEVAETTEGEDEEGLGDFKGIDLTK